MSRWLSVVLLLCAIPAAVAVRGQTEVADTILTNGKIITVDDRFSIAQAVAVKGDRFIAVGTNQEISRLAGPSTRRIDLRGRSVTPGFIDHHAHYMRQGSTWTEEVRWDGVDSRKQAVEMLRAKVRTAAADEWIYNQMGWSYDQFADDKKPFTREELDQIAPNHPVYLQEAYYRVYLNSRGLAAMGIRDGAPDPDWMPKGQVVRDASGRATGVILDNGTRPIEERILHLPRSRERIEASHRAMHLDVNRAGITAYGTATCENGAQVPSAAPFLLQTYQRWADERSLTVRVYCHVTIPTGTTEAQIAKVLPEFAKLKLFQGNEYLNTFSYGENLGIANDNMLDVTPPTTPEQFRLWGVLARELAKNGIPIHIHATLEGSISGFLDQIEKIDREYPIRTLRWALYHVDQVNRSHLERMKKLGMYLGVHMRPMVMGGIFNRIRGERSFDNPPLQWIQQSGIMWGVGTDFNLNQFRPFSTLWFMVTGRMVGGTVVNRQPIGREDALIAHTRRNAFFLFQENNLGSIQPGRLADLVVIDRDYLTVPADQIKDIKPVLTMVGGRVVYDAAAASSSAHR